MDGEAEVLLDPNTLSDDGTVALAIKRFSENAEFLAYGLSSSGSDWITIRVMRVEGRVVLPDTLSWVKFTSIAWTHDHKGFFYNRYPQPKYLSFPILRRLFIFLVLDMVFSLFSSKFRNFDEA